MFGIDGISNTNGTGGILDLLACWEPIEDVFPDADDGLQPLPDVQLDCAITD